MFSKITVDYYGAADAAAAARRRLRVPEPRMAVIQPYDKGSLAAIEKAIRDSDLGVNPTNDGSIIRIVFPQLTEERRKELIKVAHKRRRRGGSPSAPSAGTPRTRSTSWPRTARPARTRCAARRRSSRSSPHRYVAQVDDLLKHKEAELLEV